MGYSHCHPFLHSLFIRSSIIYGLSLSVSVMTPKISPENINSEIPVEAKAAIADLVLAWARFDALVSQLFIVCYGMTLDVGALFVGNMDTRTKFDKLIKLYSHFGLSGADNLKTLRKLHGKHVDLRNTINHAACVGHLISDTGYIVFAPVKAVHGQIDEMLIEAWHLDQFKAATEFASKNGDKLNELVDAFMKKRPKSAPPDRQ